MTTTKHRLKGFPPLVGGPHADAKLLLEAFDTMRAETLFAQRYPDDMDAFFEEMTAQSLGNLSAAALQQAEDDAYARLRASTNAKARLAGESYRGSTLLEWDELTTFAEDDWLVEGMIGRGSDCVLVGRSMVGKSFATIGLAAHGAIGRPWLGLKIAQFKTLIYLSEGAKSYGARLLATCQAYDIDPADLSANLRVRSGANLNSDAFLAIVESDVAEFKPDLIIYDTLNGTAGLENENDAPAIARIYNRSREAAGTATVLFVHHPKRGDSETSTNPAFRGSGAIKNDADTVLTLYSDKTFDGPESHYIALSTDEEHGGKSKDAEGRTLQGLYLKEFTVGNRPEGSPVTSCAMLWDNSKTYTRADRAVREYLVSDMPMTAVEFAKAADTSLRTAQRYLKNSAYAILRDNRWYRVADETTDLVVTLPAIGAKPRQTN